MKFSLFKRAKTLAQKQSLYNRIVIVEEEGVRYLRFGNHIIQGAVSVDDPVALQIEYTKYLPLGLIFVPDVKEVLTIGLGAGSLQRLFARHCPEINLETVEIDSEVAELAREYLFLSYCPGGKIHIMEGRTFIRRSNKRYDMLILDAYQAKSIPFHLTTREFLRETKAILKPEGAVVSNLWSSDRNLFLSMLKTYETVFAKVYRFPAAVGNNIILVASDLKLTAEEISSRALEIQNRCKFPYDFVKCASRYDRKRLDPGGARLISDADAPENWRKRLE